MEIKETFSLFNPQDYEKELSQFGKKIFNVLLKQWNTAHTTHENVRNKQLTQKRRAKTLIDSDVPNIHYNYETENDFFNINDKSLYFNTDDVTNVDIVEIDASTDTVQMTTKNKAGNEFNDFSHLREYNRPSDTTGLLDNNMNSCEQVDIPIVNSNNGSSIKWNDMFDTELITEIDFPEDSSSNKQIYIEHSDYSDIPYQDKNKNCNEITNTINKKDRKRKIQGSNTAPKVKKFVEKPIQKQKYKKTVKCWLNNIDPNYPVIGGYDLDNIERTYENGVLQNDQVTVNKVKSGTNKKMVQAQLSNKDGIMKFRKPIESDDNNCVPDNAVISTEKIEIVKERKNKAKFVTPIKPQTCVRDITYEVIVIDSSSYEYMFNVSDEHDEVFVVLMYSDGLCQLNKQFNGSDDTIENVMICVNEKFYLIKKTVENFSELTRIMIENKTVNCYDGKQLLIFFKKQLNLQGNFKLIDVKIGGCLLDPDNPPETFVALQKQINMSVEWTIASECNAQITAWHIDMLKKCVMKLRGMLTDESLWTLFIDIEMRLLPIIVDMEQRGIMVDMVKLKQMENTLVSRMKAVEQECYEAAGRSFQINSHAQVRAILYDELRLDKKCNVKIRETICQGAKSTSETMLRSLAPVHRLPALILAYRRLHKAHATFLLGIAQHVVDGVLRPTWEQMAAATGRIASCNPNVQAIPKAPFSLSFPDGEQLLNFRSVYVAREGCTLLAADFKHVECRVFAYLAGDTALLDALKSGDDLFKVLAAKWLNKPEGQVSGEDRERTKRIVYASLYGAGARKLMDILDVGYDQALTILTSFNSRFPSLKAFGSRVAAECGGGCGGGGGGGGEGGGAGVAVAASGRRRRLPRLDARAHRQAVNFVLQGSAADICKRAMIATEQRLRAMRPCVEARLLLQIHDELVWEVAHADLVTAAGVIKEVMENCGFDCGLAGRLPVAVSAGRSWGHMEDLDLTYKHNCTF